MAEKNVVVGRGDARRGTCVLGGPTRIIVPVLGADADTLSTEVHAIAGHPHDLIEWRVDPLLAAGGDVDAACAAVLAAADAPVLATIRTTHEGGRADLTERDYRDLVTRLALSADAVDVEVARPGAVDLIGALHGAGARVIASSHDFGGTPPREELVARLRFMEAQGADVAKVACTARTPGEVLAVLEAQVWAMEGLGIPVIAISMGRLGALTRIAGPTLGCAATFATVGESSAPGQLEAERVRSVLDLLGD